MPHLPGRLWLLLALLGIVFTFSAHRTGEESVWEKEPTRMAAQQHQRNDAPRRSKPLGWPKLACSTPINDTWNLAGYGGFGQQSRQISRCERSRFNGLGTFLIR